MVGTSADQLVTLLALYAESNKQLYPRLLFLSHVYNAEKSTCLPDHLLGNFYPLLKVTGIVHDQLGLPW